MPDTEAILAANADLADAVKGLSTQVEKLAGEGTRTRRGLYGSFVGIVIMVALFVWSLFIYKHADDAQTTADHVQDYQVVTCASGNDFRAAERDLWNFILKLTAANPKQTAAEKAQAAKFKAYVEAKFAARDCTQVAK